MLVSLFLAGAAVLWLSVFGYVALLLVLAARGRRRAEERGNAPLPAVAVVVPVRNEARFIAGKLADLRRSDYPADRLLTVVVDGASTDATAAEVEAQRARGAAIELLRVEGARGKAEQLNAVLGHLRQQIVVLTDVDALLAPSCIRRLVATLQSDPATDLVGARVRPATRLLEERIHWWLLNSLWWLEGEVMGASGISGVCYAIRRAAIPVLPSDCTAEDISLALTTAARGAGVRICRGALATELRVPQTMREFLRFRRRRGAGYVRELRRTRALRAPLRWRAMRALRLYHFLVMPVLAIAVAAAALAVCVHADWHWPLLVAAAFVVPALAALFASTTLGAEGRRWWHLGVAAGRLAGLTWWSLLGLRDGAAAPVAQGE